MICVHRVCKRYGSHVVLEEVSLEVGRGETVVLLGPSGSGKTTLLRCLVGLERIDSGEIEVDGIRVCAGESGKDLAARLRAIRMRCGFVFQQFHLFPHRSVLSNLTLAPVKVRAMEHGEAQALARKLLEQVGLAQHADKRPSRLSGGEQQRVAIARALAMQPDYLLYDEPTSSLDPERAREIWKIMQELSAEGQTQIIVTHQEELARAVADRVVRMREGRVEEACCATFNV